MKLKISNEIFDKHPSTIIGVVCIKGLKGVNANTDSLLATEEARIRSVYSKDTFTEDLNIKVWRDAYRSFGVKPSDAKSSVENLYRLVLSGRDIKRISPLVDLYNAISLKYMLPLGGEDLDMCSGDIELCFASESEPKVKLLGDDIEDSPKSGEVIYRDSVSAICRRWNWREADRTKLTETTKNCILVVETILSDRKESLECALDELSKNIKADEVSKHLLSNDKNELKL